jgi:hypothetical protein
MSSIKSNKVLIDITPDKNSTPARTSRALVIGLNGPGSTLWKTQPALQDSGSKLVTIGAALGDADASLKSIETQLATARGVRDTTQKAFDVAYGVYVANAQTYAATPEDAASIGLVVRGKNKYPLVAPVGLDATFDLIKSLIQIHITKTPGERTFLVEISSDPIGPATWKRLPGTGAVQELSGYGPGLYWVRAASVRAKAQSDYTAPVAVLVK